MTEKVENGKVVSFSYKLYGKDEDVIVEQTEKGQPMQYLHGNNNIIPGLEKAMEGMSAGDEKEVRVLAAEAYGEYNEELLFSVPKENFPQDTALAPGMQFQTETDDGSMVVTVKEVTDDTVVVDANHPMAGENLKFDIKIEEVRDATPQETEHGHVHSHGHDH
jgi:FKBP-type peptidyl-prolyl cis-trans isomerase SlyD